jgi:hypothetical protein
VSSSGRTLRNAANAGTTARPWGVSKDFNDNGLNERQLSRGASRLKWSNVVPFTTDSQGWGPVAGRKQGTATASTWYCGPVVTDGLSGSGRLFCGSPC